MLAKKYRLCKKPDIEAVFKKGRKIIHPFFILHIANNDLAYSRFAFPVSKKISKKAVERNRVRRIERESIRLHLKEIRGGYDVVVVATKKTPEIRKTYLLWETMAAVLQKHGLMKPIL